MQGRFMVGSNRIAVGSSLLGVRNEERKLILEREARVKEWRKSLPRRKKPDSQKPGPVTWIRMY